MIQVVNNGKIDKYVYDISLDGTVVNALGMNILSNTDGFNFQMPLEFRYTKEHPYISKGLGRNYPKGKESIEVEGDVAEFEDMYMNENYALGINKMGLGIDEYVPRSINFSRKNYSDLLDEETGEIKLVGNTIKSKKMPIYIEKFLDKGIRLLLADKGKEFLELYYDYIEKIYNMQIPLKDIASIGKIKTSIGTYKENCKTLTKGGTKKSRQAWYELAIKHNMDVHMGDTIYYINTGEKKNDSDVKRITHYFYKNDKGQRIDYVNNSDGTPMTDKKGNKISLTKTIEREYTKTFKGWKKKSNDDRKPTKLEFGRTLYPNLQEEDEILFNCVLLPNNIIDDEDDHFCDDDFCYNRDKYINMFNNKVKPLLVCFDSSIRYRIDENGNTINNILIATPKDRKTFTEAQCKLISGQPYFSTDQDTYKQLMTMDDKEIVFWKHINKRPLFEEECGMNWDEIKRDYDERMAIKLQDGISCEVAAFQKFIDSLSKEDIEEFEGFPKEISSLIYDKYNDGIFYSYKYDVEIGRITDITDKFSDGQKEFNDLL